MPNQINSNNTPETYNAGDLTDAYSLAECDLQWMSTAITDARIRVKKLKAELTELNASAEYYFYGLEQVLEMYEYLADDRRHYHAKEAEAYKVKWEANKKAVTL